MANFPLPRGEKRFDFPSSINVLYPAFFRLRPAALDQRVRHALSIGKRKTLRTGLERLLTERRRARFFNRLFSKFKCRRIWRLGMSPSIAEEFSPQSCFSAFMDPLMLGLTSQILFTANCPGFLDTGGHVQFAFFLISDNMPHLDSFSSFFLA